MRSICKYPRLTEDADGGEEGALASWLGADARTGLRPLPWQTRRTKDGCRPAAGYPATWQTAPSVEPGVYPSFPGQCVPFDGKGESINVRPVDGTQGLPRLAEVPVGLRGIQTFRPPLSPSPRRVKRTRTHRCLRESEGPHCETSPGISFSSDAPTSSNASFADDLSHTRAEASRQVQVYLVSPLAALGVSSPLFPSLPHKHTYTHTRARARAHHPLAPSSTRCRQYHAGAKRERASRTG
ncbi:hypothetical protein LY76DRAFT_246873 [Colletotrichum caudatum]|nr:hypothetical protein LY76DRAFT_246873 [Colletotrichum caudatum]